MTNTFSAITNAPGAAPSEACWSLVFLIGLLSFCSLVTVLRASFTKKHHDAAA